MNGAVYERLIFIMILNTDFGYNHCKSTENDRLEFSSDKIVPMFFSYLLVTFDITFLKKSRIVIFVKTMNCSVYSYRVPNIFGTISILKHKNML